MTYGKWGLTVSHNYLRALLKIGRRGVAPVNEAPAVYGSQ